MLEGLIQRIKVRAVCRQLDIEPRMAKVMVHVYGLTHGGERTGVFELKPGETVDKRLGIYAKLARRNDALGEELADMKRLFEDVPYREAMLGVYMQAIQPKVAEMSIRDMVKALRSRQLKKHRPHF